MYVCLCLWAHSRVRDVCMTVLVIWQNSPQTCLHVHHVDTCSAPAFARMFGNFTPFPFGFLSFVRLFSLSSSFLCLVLRFFLFSCSLSCFLSAFFSFFFRFCSSLGSFLYSISELDGLEQELLLLLLLLLDLPLPFFSFFLVSTFSFFLSSLSFKFFFFSSSLELDELELDRDRLDLAFWFSLFYNKRLHICVKIPFNI